MAPHLARVAPGPDDLLFPGEHRYHAVRRVWRATCAAAPRPTTPPYVRGHAAQAGFPIVRRQELMGHADPTMTMLYMQHAPEAYLDQDPAAIAAHMTRVTDHEIEARAEAARRGLKPA